MAPRRRSGFPIGFRILTGLMGWIVPWLLRAWFWTCRITVLHPDLERKWLKGNPHVIGTLWHQNFIVYAWYFERRHFLVMSSWSKDGEIMVRVMRQMGYYHVRGSSSRGGREALYDMVTLAKKGATCAIIADGPKGPARVAKIGAVLAASHSGLPILPGATYCVNARYLRNWDRTAIPLPFSRIFMCFGPPIFVPPDQDAEQIEAWRVKVEEATTRAENEAKEAGRRVTYSGARSTT